MTSPYSLGNYYPGNYPQNQEYMMYSQNEKRGPSVFSAMSVGMLAGGTAGYFMNRYPVKNGTVSDSFASEALNTFIDKGYATEDKKFFKQMRNVLKKIDKIKKADKFKKLINKNPEVADRVYNTVSKTCVLETVTEDNLHEKVKAFKQALESERQVGVINMKHAAAQYWDDEQNKFIKPEKSKDIKTFKALKATKNKIQWKKALKYGGITAGILGALTIGYRMLLTRPTPPLQRVPVQNMYGTG